MGYFESIRAGNPLQFLTWFLRALYDIYSLINY
jgi:hypothetical protein